MMSVNELLEVLKYFIIHSKYFPDFDWLTAHVPVTDDQIWKDCVFSEKMTSKMQRFCRLMHR